MFIKALHGLFGGLIEFKNSLKSARLKHYRSIIIIIVIVLIDGDKIKWSLIIRVLLRLFNLEGKKIVKMGHIYLGWSYCIFLSDLASQLVAPKEAHNLWLHISIFYLEHKSYSNYSKYGDYPPQRTSILNPSINIKLYWLTKEIKSSKTSSKLQKIIHFWGPNLEYK